MRVFHRCCVQEAEIVLTHRDMKLVEKAMLAEAKPIGYAQQHKNVMIRYRDHLQKDISECARSSLCCHSHLG